ncbi:hypothetical protein BD779DRAFT_919470 [Infundibulicybe gibba]|nr:hypothetical protein BD779DRAFT_919470 [Infundibulicybe gibba]
MDVGAGEQSCARALGGEGYPVRLQLVDPFHLMAMIGILVGIGMGAFGGSVHDHIAVLYGHITASILGDGHKELVPYSYQQESSSSLAHQSHLVMSDTSVAWIFFTPLDDALLSLADLISDPIQFDEQMVDSLEAGEHGALHRRLPKLYHGVSVRHQNYYTPPKAIYPNSAFHRSPFLRLAETHYHP